MKPDMFQAALRADAGPLPPVDERAAEQLAARCAQDLWHGFPTRAAATDHLQITPIAPRRRDFTVFWLGPIALAACVLLAITLNRPAAPESLSASIAAVTSAARPHIELAALPMQPYRHNLATLDTDTRNLMRFVGDQLDVLPRE